MSKIAEEAGGVRSVSVVGVGVGVESKFPSVQERTSGAVDEPGEEDNDSVRKIWQGLLSRRHSTATEVG